MNSHHLYICLLVVMALGLEARADAQGSQPFRIAFIGGASFGGKTSYNLKDSSGSSISTFGDQASAASPFFASELTYQPTFLGASIFSEATRYTYSSGNSFNGEVGIFAMPRLAVHLGATELWTGVGFGLMVSGSGPESVVDQGVTITQTNLPVGFAWSPRIGIDVPIDAHFFIGAEVDYVSTSGMANLTGSESGTTEKFTLNFTRRWYVTALRCGARF